MKFRLLVCLLSYILSLTPTPNRLDYSVLSASHTRIAWSYSEIANSNPIFYSWKCKHTVTIIETFLYFRCSRLTCAILNKTNQCAYPHPFFILFSLFSFFPFVFFIHSASVYLVFTYQHSSCLHLIWQKLYNINEKKQDRFTACFKNCGTNSWVFSKRF